MPRVARIVVPEEPHHVIQRGNRRLPTFFCEDDYCRYLGLLRERCEEHSVEVWAYCLMTNQNSADTIPILSWRLYALVKEIRRPAQRLTTSRSRSR